MKRLFNSIKKFNDKVAIYLTVSIGTMACVYVFTLFTLLPIVMPSTMRVIEFVSSSVLQLVLLPVLMVGENLLSRGAEDRATLQSENVKKLLEKNNEELVMLRKMITKQHEQLVLLSNIQKDVRSSAGATDAGLTPAAD